MSIRIQPCEASGRHRAAVRLPQLAATCRRLPLWLTALATAAVLLTSTPGRAANVYLQALSNGSPAGVVHSDTAVGTDGSVYVVGDYWNLNHNATGQLKLGSTTLVQSYGGTSGSYLAKLGPDGGWKWATRLYSPSDSGAFARAVTVSGNNIYITGAAKGSVIIEDALDPSVMTTVTAGGSSTNRAPYVIKLTLDGHVVWGRMVKAYGMDPRFDGSVNDVVVDGLGNAIICGRLPFQNLPDAAGKRPYPSLPEQGWVFAGVRTPPVAQQGAYLAKLDGSGTWQWALGYSSGNFANEFYGLAVDALDRVYVTGWVNGDSSDIIFRRDGTSFTSGYAVIGDRSAMVARIKPDGTWGTPQDKQIRFFESPGGAFTSRGCSLLFAKGKLYLALEYNAECRCSGDNALAATKQGTAGVGNDLAIFEFRADLGAVEGLTTIKGPGNEVAGSNLASDAAGNLYFSGIFDQPQANFGTEVFLSAPEGAATGPDVTSPKANLFVGKLNANLAWEWVQRAEGIPPDYWGGAEPVPPKLVIDQVTGRAYLFGSFYSGTLRLGSDATASELSDPGNYVSFLTAIDSSGSFLQKVELNVISDFGGAAVRPPVGRQIYLRGEAIAASVPSLIYEDGLGNHIDPSDTEGIRNRAVVRRTCTGYEVLGTSFAGDASSYGFNISEDTELRFNWKTEYALTISNNLSGSNGGLSSTAAGNPDPVVQKHWVEESTISTAFIDGVIPSPNANEFGTRYRNTGYTANGAAGPPGQALGFTGTPLDLGARAEYQPGDSPWTVEFWVRPDAVDIYSRRILSWSPLLYFSLEGGTAATNFVFNSQNSFSGTVVLSSVPVRQGEWHHFAFVRAQAGWTVYYDGDVVATQATTAPVGTTTSPLLLGQFFDGALDEFRIWKVARSQSEIRSYMQRSLPNAADSRLLAYWNYDSAGGGSVLDLRNPGITAALGGDLVATAGIVPDRSGLFVPWTSVQSRQQVPQFVMNAPAVIEYHWAKENRIQVGAAPSDLANVPVTVGGGVTNVGTGEVWFPDGATVRMSAPEKPANPVGYQLKGFIGGSGDVTSVTGDGQGVRTGTRHYEILNLRRGSSITWDYTDRVYKGKVTIGQAIDFGAKGTFTGNEEIPAGEALDVNRAPQATTIVSDAPAGSSIEDMRVWDDVDNKLYPLRPGVILLEWARVAGTANERPVMTEITVTYPAASDYLHVANTPPVLLDPSSTDAVAFVGLKYSEPNAVITDTSEFSSEQTGRSVLLFSTRPDGSPANGDLTRETLRVRTVETRRWDVGLEVAKTRIGTPVASVHHDSNVPHNGYVYFEQARYNPQIYDRKTLLGPIIPVNRYPTARTEESLVVVWYRLQEGLAWPHQAVKYDPEWPRDTGERIVIASRVGSEGYNSSSQPQLVFDPTRYEQVTVYNQPDPGRPGYNPNEEHALLAPSLLHAAAANPPPAVYALRNNLNDTSESLSYTSDPFALVQYYDNVLTNWGMKVYAVLTEDTNLPFNRRAVSLDQPSVLTVQIGDEGAVEFRADAHPFSVTGFKTNEVVDLEPNGNLVGLGAGRYRIALAQFGPPAVFHLEPVNGGDLVTASAVVTNDLPEVVLTRAFPYTFEYLMRAGEPVLAPYPLQQVIGATPCEATHGENLDPGRLVYWEDHKSQPWAVSGTADAAGGLRARFYYPLQPQFWDRSARPGDCFAFVGKDAPVWVTNHVAWPPSVPTLKAGETLTYAGGEIQRDDANRPGLPGVLGWAAGKIVFDDSNPAMDLTKTTAAFLARMAAPLLPLEVPLPLAEVPSELQPAAGNVTVEGTRWFFKQLDASLLPRIYYDQGRQVLAVRGFIDGKTIGDPDLTASPSSIPVLQPNILTVADSEALMGLAASPVPAWTDAVNELVRLSRDPAGATTNGYGVGLDPVEGKPGQARPAVQFGPGLALLPNQGLLDPSAALADGYVTLAENDDASMGDAPVALHIVRVSKKPLFRGAIKTIAPTNPFDEKVTLRHSGDFGANAGDLEFEWYYRPDDGAVVGPPDTEPTSTWSVFADPSGRKGLGFQELSLTGAGEVTLTDNRFFVRWRHSKGGAWSEWAGAANSRPPGPGESAKSTYVSQLAEGWVKRVIAGVNPFDARIQDFRNNDSPATYSSMVQQAGAPYRGAVALNNDPDVIENTGLVELYTTVLERAKDLSIDLLTPISTPAVNNTLLLAASRIADLQLLLGHEAFGDAQDPTIGFGSDSVEYGVLAPTIHTFQNQVGSLLEEELALLRGRSEEGAYPAYNRLLWNFTRAEGEAAYALSYNIKDENHDGFINEADGRALYPQGHGDAWGHYLSALKTYYDLLRHPNFVWQSRSENLQLEGVVLAVDYLDERKFAQAAAAKAKAGAEIVNLTYRSRYVEDPDGQWQGYQDTDTSRAWGVTDWARRAGTGALLDWVTANAILPAGDTAHTGIQQVDRTTVKDLAQISAEALAIRKHLDDANIGLNPIGLASDVVPFDIDPTGFGPDASAPATHFEQVYTRALKALQNALDLFNHANQLGNMLRQVAQTTDQFAADARAQDLDFRNRLIEIFGTPYEGTIGPGNAYPPGYQGPDLYLYMYVDVTGIQDVPPPSEDFTAYWKPFPGGLVHSGAPGGGGDTLATAFHHYFPNDDLSLESAVNTDFSEVLELKMPMTAKGYSFQAPAAWGTRQAPGEIQQVLSELVQAEADLQLALHAYDGAVGDVKDMADLVRAQSGLQAETIQIQERSLKRTTTLQAVIMAMDGVAATANFAGELAEETAEATAETMPTSVGLATDVTAPARGALKLVGTLADNALKSVAYAAERTALALEGVKELKQLEDDFEIVKADMTYAMQEQLKELEGLLGEEARARLEVFRAQEAMRLVSDKYRALLARGTRLIEERADANRKTAGATQQNRYQDYTFRVFRNEALSKYRAAFDLAARYAYLAAKAYDYETNLDPNDPASAQPLLTRIVRARTLGAIENGEPRLGSGGIADALATLKVNFDVLKTQMGFNNPQGESGQFSFRHELFRMKSADGAAWRQELEKYRVADLWQVPEFRRFCRPFAPQSAGAQPGLVVPFSTRVVFGKNLFGWPLGPGDSAYDPTLFATKVRSVGVWFDDYAGEGLSTTPRVYLVPAGLDVMYVPDSVEFATREWNVVDQKIPVPLPVGESGLRDPSWIPLKDSLNGTLAEIRRYSSFRAFHNAGFSPEEMSFDSRLVGRSVWNTRWLLIIPGGTFLADQTEGLDTFIYGLKAPNGPATDSQGNKRDGHGISDIKLSFQTYAISGN